ncbi:hypothetical protein B9Z19DRAFT_977975, partial [Tuber borchii]
KENSGFEWDGERGLPTAGEGVWDKYITKHPKVAKIRPKALSFYTVMNQICSGHTANGHYASTMMEAIIEGVEQQTGSDYSGGRDTPHDVDFMFRGEGGGESSEIEMKIMSGGSIQGKGKGKRISEEKLEN